MAYMLDVIEVNVNSSRAFMLTLGQLPLLKSLNRQTLYLPFK